MAKQRASALSEIEVKSHLFLVHDQLNYRDGLWAKPPRSIPNTPDECPHYSRIVSYDSQCSSKPTKEFGVTFDKHVIPAALTSRHGQYRIQRRIDSLLDEAESAISKYDWEAVPRAAEAVLALSPNNGDCGNVLCSCSTAVK